MRHMRRTAAGLLAAALLVCLAGCGNESAGPGETAPAQQTEAAEFQKNMCQSQYFYIQDACEAEGGIYFNYDGYLYYLDKTNQKATILCGKPDCEHKGSRCNAWINSRGMWVRDDQVYCITFAGEDKLVTAMDRDGTNRRTVQQLQYSMNGAQSSGDDAVCYQGVVYYPYNDVLYAVPLGDDMEKATAIWGEESAGTTGGSFFFDGNELHFRLWPDGDSLYFMINAVQEDGTCKDTLMAYSLTDETVQQVWQTPDEAAVGPWYTTGVSVQAWYVQDGTITYYLAGNGLWRSKLPDGEPERLVDTSAIPHGSVLFSEDTTLLLNDALSARVEREGGDSLTLYDTSGNLQKEISLTSLLQEHPGITGFALLFLSDGDLYFIAHAGTWGDIEDGVQYQDRADVLCRIDLDTGDCTEIHTFTG